MKIGKFSRSRQSPGQTGRGSSPMSVRHSPFLDTLQREEAKSYPIEAAVEEIDKWARRFRKAPTWENLRRYKEAVRHLLRGLVDQAYQVGEKSFFDRQGRRRLYILIERVDAKLEELTAQFMRDQADTLELVRRMDEIRGMLLDLYT